MTRSLVIVESPAKAKTINKYLGKSFLVKSSVGHIRDLPQAGSGKKAVDPKEKARKAAETRKLTPEQKLVRKAAEDKRRQIENMGIDPEHGWIANYLILPDKQDVVAELQRLADKSDIIYLATDLDREGEAIAWHLRESIGGDHSRFRRVVFNEITRNAIQKAFESPGQVDMDRVNSQQARRFLDRLVGYLLSPLLWDKIARGLSAGRVQSVALRLLVEREREIHAFVPEEFWELTADCSSGMGSLRLDVVKDNGKTYRPTSKAASDAAMERLRAAASALGQGQSEVLEVVKRENKPTTTRPSPPFITSTLQQAASTRFGFSVGRTMRLAQGLYENGYITYMRTDSLSLSQDALTAARQFIEGQYGQKYLPDSPNYYKSKSGAQEAHEAIRPTNVTLKPAALKVDRDAQRLYELIWRQFLGCQMTPAEYISTTLTARAGAFEARAKGRILKFDGFTRVNPPAGKKEDTVLPDIQTGTMLALDKLNPEQKFTKPPARFTEAALVRELEKRGIGRPSTYVSIISRIQDRGYVKVHKRRFFVEKIGDIVTDRLVESFGNLLDYSFTERLEEQLDAVAEGRLGWKDLLDRFYQDFSTQLARAYTQDGMRPNDPVETEVLCDMCGRHMMIRTAKTGVFLGCSGYSLPKAEKCTHTMNLMPGDEVDTDDENTEINDLRSRKRCPVCETAMDSYFIDGKRKLHICGNSPDCKGQTLEHGDFGSQAGQGGPVIPCDKCGSDMLLKDGRFGKFFSCTNELCKNTRKMLKNGEPAPPKMDPVPMPELSCEKVEDHYVLRDGAAGLFLAASQFPRHRETRAPLLSELLPHRSEIDSKYDFLMSAPVADPEGHPTVLRYDRKLKTQYLGSLRDGKYSSWQVRYQDGHWVERKPTSGARKKKAN
jgi:DNA topoisomerase-1